MELKGSDEMQRIVKILKDRSGATGIEYALVASLIAIAAMAGYASLGDGVENKFSHVENKI